MRKMAQLTVLFSTVLWLNACDAPTKLTTTPTVIPNVAGGHSTVSAASVGTPLRICTNADRALVSYVYTPADHGLDVTNNSKTSNSPCLLRAGFSAARIPFLPGTKQLDPDIMHQTWLAQTSQAIQPGMKSHLTIAWASLCDAWYQWDFSILPELVPNDPPIDPETEQVRSGPQTLLPGRGPVPELDGRSLPDIGPGCGTPPPPSCTPHCDVTPPCVTGCGPVIDPPCTADAFLEHMTWTDGVFAYESVKMRYAGVRVWFTSYGLHYKVQHDPGGGIILPLPQDRVAFFSQVLPAGWFQLDPIPLADKTLYEAFQTEFGCQLGPEKLTHANVNSWGWLDFNIGNFDGTRFD